MDRLDKTVTWEYIEKSDKIYKRTAERKHSDCHSSRVLNVPLTFFAVNYLISTVLLFWRINWKTSIWEIVH